jgi:hypothetical protein
MIDAYSFIFAYALTLTEIIKAFQKDGTGYTKEISLSATIMDLDTLII